MYRKLLVLALILIATSLSARQYKVLEFRGGSLNPKGTPSGVIFGAYYGTAIDERVDIGLSLDLFRKNHTEESVYDTSYYPQTNEQTVIKDLEYTTLLIPIAANFTIHMPINRNFNWHMGAGFTYSFLWDKETDFNFDDPKKTTRNYQGFGWIGRAGVEYIIGSQSSILLELLYNNGKVKRDENKSGSVWKEVNVTGFGFRAGLRLEMY